MWLLLLPYGSILSTVYIQSGVSFEKARNLSRFEDKQHRNGCLNFDTTEFVV